MNLIGMLHNCLVSSNIGEYECDENKPYCRSPMVESTNTSEVATVMLKECQPPTMTIMEHVQVVIDEYKRDGNLNNHPKPPLKAQKKNVRRQTLPTSSLVLAASQQERFELLLNLLESDSGKGKQHQSIIELAVQLASTVKLDSERLELLVEYLTKMAQHKVTTVSGQSMLGRNYLLFRVLAQAVHVDRLAQSPEQVYNEIQQSKASIRSLVSDLLEGLHFSSIKQFVTKLVNDSFAVLNNKEFPLAGTLILLIQNELVEQITKGGLDIDRAGCLALLGLLINRSIQHMAHLPAVTYEVLEGEDVQCDVCKSINSTLAMKFIIERTSSNEFIICRECCLVSPKSKNVGKLLMNLLPLALGNYSNNFQQERVKESKVLLVAHLAEELIVTRNKFLEVMEHLERSPIKVVAVDISEQCLAYFNTFSERVGLVFQFRSLFSCWTGELECDNHLRRIKAIKELPQLLQLYRPRSSEHDLDDYKDKIEQVLTMRTMDINENVRLEALKAIIKTHTKCETSELKDIVVDRLNDSDHRVRSLAISFIEDQSIAIFSEPISFCQAVLKLVELTFDTYGSIRKRAIKCIQQLLLNKKRNMKEQEENISDLLDHPTLKSNREYLKIIVGALLSAEGSEGVLNRLLEALLVTNINEGKILFAQLLVQKYKGLLASHLDSFLEIEAGGPNRHGEHLYSCVLNIINELLELGNKFTSRQRSRMEQLLLTVEENVFTQAEEVAKSSLPLLVKLNLVFGREAVLKDVLGKCFNYLQSCRSNDNLSAAEIENLYRSMLILSVGSINLHKLVRDQQLISCYECILWWANSNPNKEVRQHALEALCLFWQYDQKFLYYSEEVITRVLPYIEDESTILLVYRCFESTIRQLIERQSNAPIIGVVECLFIKTCRRFVNCADPATRLTIIKLIDQFIRIGNSNPMEFVRYVIAYLCDPEQDVRQVASSIASRLQPRFILNNFKESMTVVADSIFQNYGEVEVAAEGRCFFSSLIFDQHRTQTSSKRSLSNKQNANRITFVKKIGELITNCECLSCPSDQKLLELCCAIVDSSNEFERFDFIELLGSLNTKIEQNYHKLVKTLKRIVREGCDDSEDEPAIKEGYTMYRLLYSLERLTGGKSYKSKIGELEGHSGSYFTIPDCLVPRLDANSDIEQLYHSIKNMHENTHCQRPKKVAFKTYMKTTAKSKSKSKRRQTQMRSAPKISLSSQLLSDTNDDESDITTSEYRAKLRRRPKPPK